MESSGKPDGGGYKSEEQLGREGMRLKVEGVSKEFPGVKALEEVSLEVRPGEVHALVGENGAGKSTLMRLIAGVEAPDGGEIFLDGESLRGIDEYLAGELGIGMVHQEGSLIPGLSVAENVFAARQPTKFFGAIDWRGMGDLTRDLLRELQVEMNPGRLVANLSPAEKQMVEIAKALSHRLRLLVLDEPSSTLTITETERLFEVVRHLTDRGVSVIYISHRLTEVFEIADRATVLRDGKVTGVRPTDSVSEGDLIQLMVGRELSAVAPENRRAEPDAPISLWVEGFSAPPEVLDASVEVKAGEIVCLAGLIGAGRTELCEAVFGLRAPAGGRVLVDGREAKIRTPADAMRAGIGMIPEDRRDAGLFLNMSITENVVATNQHTVSVQGLISRRRSERLATSYVERLRIVTPHMHQTVANLSGGNQQKVLLAKWLAREPRILLVDEPTRGVDVGARADIYAVLRKLAEGGTALIVVSSDLPEVLTLAHRIVVMSEGRTVGQIDAREADETSILRLASPASIKVGDERA